MGDSFPVLVYVVIRNNALLFYLFIFLKCNIIGLVDLAYGVLEKPSTNATMKSFILNIKGVDVCAIRYGL